MRRDPRGRLRARSHPYQHVLANQWDRAIRLCRFVKDDAVWSCLAAMAVAAKDLNVAEIAYAAIEEVEKVQFIAGIKKVPTEEGRSAELALFRRKPDEAEAILVQAGDGRWTCARLFDWDRALDRRAAQDARGHRHLPQE